MKILIIAMAALFGGCSFTAQPMESKVYSDGSVVVDNDMGEGTVKIVEIDGVRCAVLVGYSKGGISCDWK